MAYTFGAMPPLLNPKAFVGRGGPPFAGRPPNVSVPRASEYRKSQVALKEGSVELLLEQSGITGVDDAARQKLEELPLADRESLVADFLAANEAEPIYHPSKWLFSRARSQLVQMKRSGVAPQISLEGAESIPELPGVLVDKECVEKMAELDPQERATLIGEFQAQRTVNEIRNPSGWFFSKARSTIVQRLTSGKSTAGNKPHQANEGGEFVEPEELQRLSAPDVLLPGGELHGELSEIGVDEQAIGKLRELTPQDLQSLLQQFNTFYAESQINDPSRWLYSKARSIAAAKTQYKLGQATARNHGGPVVAAGGRRPPPQPTASGVTVPLPGVMLDDRAMVKLAELTHAEQAELVAEFAVEAARKPILNPSGWVYGRARTKLLDRIVGTDRSGRRASPY